MSMKQKVSKIIIGLSNRPLLNWMPDHLYLQLLYWARIGKKLRLNPPVLFNEKLQWLKLHDRKEIYTIMVDKYEVKDYVAKAIGEQYVVPVIGVYDKFEDIDFEKLPQQFVLKCTHDSAGLIICRDKSSLDMKKAEEKIKKSLNRNYFWHAREWPYKDVKPRILAEQYIKDDKQKEDESLIVYKIFCFEGKPTIIQVITNDKRENESIDYFDVKWDLLDIRQNFPNSEIHLSKPSQLELMLSLASKLSEGFHFLRVDFYEANEQVYFSEFTFYTDAGFEKYYPEYWDEKLGKLIHL